MNPSTDISSQRPRPAGFMRLTFLLLVASASLTFAHPLLQNAMWVVFTPERVRVALNVSLREIMVAQRLDSRDGVPLDDAALAGAVQKHGEYVVAHLSAQAGGHELAGHVINVTPPILFAAEPEQTFYQYELEYAWPAGSAPPAKVSFTHSMLREWPYAPGQPWDVSYALRLRHGEDPGITTGLLRTNAPEEFATGFTESAGQLASATEVRSTSSFGSYFTHGVMHILTGWDHLLFVTALVLATATFWEMFQVIAAFTLAHTITLATSVLTGFRLPDSFIEPVIAGSIVVVAVQNFVAPRRSHGALRLAIAFGFGLVHGLGFAGGLRDAMSELGSGAVLVALLAFSVGVEIGHQSVVLPVLGLLRLGGDGPYTRFRALALRYGSAAISFAGAYYLYHALTTI